MICSIYNYLGLYFAGMLTTYLIIIIVLLYFNLKISKKQREVK